MENNNNSQININEAIAWFKNYKSYFYLTDDDVQDCLIKFFKYYKSNMGANVGSYCKMLVQQLKVTQFRNKNLNKNNGIVFSLDSSFNDDSEDGNTYYLDSIGSHEIHIEMDNELHQENNKRMVKEYLEYLTDKQREVFQLHYFDEISIVEIAKMKGVTRQAIHSLINVGINRIKNKLK